MLCYQVQTLSTVRDSAASSLPRFPDCSQSALAAMSGKGMQPKCHVQEVTLKLPEAVMPMQYAELQQRPASAA